MKRHTFAAIFVLSPSKTRKDGTSPINAVVTINGQRASFSTGKLIKPEEWEAMNLICFTQVEVGYLLSKKVSYFCVEFIDRTSVEMKHFLAPFVLISYCLCCLYSCNSDKGYGDLSKLNFTDAKLLYVTGFSEYGGGGSEQDPQLYKMTHRGQSIHLPFLDDRGNIIPATFCQLRDLNDNFLCMSLGIPGLSNSPEYIVDKQTGNLYPVTQTNPRFAFTLGVSSDQQNNLYMFGGEGGGGSSSFYKIKAPNVYEFNYEKLSLDYNVIPIWGPVVDAAGNIAFSIGSGKWVLKPTGSSHYIPIAIHGRNNGPELFSLKNRVGFFTFQEPTYRYPNHQRDPASFCLVTINAEQTGLDTTKLQDLGYSEYSLQNPTDIIYCKDIAVFLDRDSVPYFTLHGNNVRKIELPFTPRGRPLLLHDKMYLVGSNKFSVYDLETNSINVLFDDNDYSIEDYVVNIDGSIAVVAVNIRRGQKITGTIVNGMIQESMEPISMKTRITQCLSL